MCLTRLRVDVMAGLAMKIMLHHLTGSLRGRTQYFDTDSLTFGVASGCSVLFDPTKDPVVSPVHAEFTVRDHTPTLRDRSGQNALLINGRQTVEAALHDGDLIQFGDKGPLFRFRIQPAGTLQTKPWRYIVADSRDIVVRTPHRRYMSPLYLAGHVLEEVVRYGSRTAKIIAALTVTIPLVLIIALGVGLYYQYLAVRASEQRIAELVGQVETGRLTQAELERRIARERETVAALRRDETVLKEQLQASLKEQVAARRSEKELRAIRQKLRALETSQRFAEDIIGRFEKGVGLLQGGYALKEKASGRPLRYQGFDENGYPLLDENGKPILTLEGSTPEMVIFYAGTGFLIDTQGTILTNRHIARMWEVYEPIQKALQSGFEPDLRILRIFFPKSPMPYDLEVLAVSDRADLAILRTKDRPTHIKPLKLAPPGKVLHVGEPVIVLSYPGTFDIILSRLAPPMSAEVMETAGTDPAKLPKVLSQKGLIRPLATHGHLADVSVDVITYEARSASGSSGGPVLDREGDVIAVNHSVLQRIGGVNLGLPVHIVWEELAQLRTGRAALSGGKLAFR